MQSTHVPYNTTQFIQWCGWKEFLPHWFDVVIFPRESLSPFDSLGTVWFSFPVSTCFSLTCSWHFIILLMLSLSSFELFTLQALAISPIQWYSWNSTFNFREILSRKQFSISSEVIFPCPPKLLYYCCIYSECCFALYFSTSLFHANPWCTWCPKTKILLCHNNSIIPSTSNSLLLQSGLNNWIGTAIRPHENCKIRNLVSFFWLNIFLCIEKHKGSIQKNCWSYRWGLIPL